MRNYHDADANINEIIAKEIAFKKRYQVEYISKKLDMNHTVLQYKVNDLQGNTVNNARFNVVVTRPNNHKHDQELSNPSVEKGVYTFAGITLPEPGRWDIMAKVSVDSYERYYNLKADTRYESVFEY
jgi:nitrogen fixation protein FixH